MGKPKYEFPTTTFPFKISKRLNVLSVPRKPFIVEGEYHVTYTSNGTRKTAISGELPEEGSEIALPPLRRLLILKRMYKKLFSPDRLERIDRMIEASNATPYTKLANCVIDLKKDQKDSKKKKGWSDSEWKKHMEYINQIAGPKHDFSPPPLDRGKVKTIEEMLPKINQLSECPKAKRYIRLSQDVTYRDPTKVAPNALKYKLTDHTKLLAVPKKVPEP